MPDFDGGSEIVLCNDVSIIPSSVSVMDYAYFQFSNRGQSSQKQTTSLLMHRIWLISVPAKILPRFGPVVARNLIPMV